MNKVKGFTLIELVVVIAVLAILSATVLAGTGQSYRRDIEQAAHLFAADVRYAQQMAIQTGSSVRVWLDHDSYRVLSYSIVDLDLLNGSRALYNGEFGAVGNGFIHFTPRGTTSTPMTVTIRNDRYLIELTLTLGAGRILVHTPVALIQ